jgi:hypothetical protein
MISLVIRILKRVYLVLWVLVKTIISKYRCGDRPAINTSVLNGPTGLDIYHTCILDALNEPVPKLCFGANELKPMEGSATCTHVHGTCGSDVKPGMYHYGPATPYLIPQIARGCEHNEHVSVRNRAVFVKPTEAKPELVGAIRKFVGKWRKEIYGNQRRRVPCMSYDAWSSRYPGPKRDMLAEGRRVDEAGVADKVFELSAFVKQESILKNETFDPRLIQGRTPEYNSVIGPWMFTASKVLSDVWGISESKFNQDPGRKFKPVTYASGMTREQLGLWHTESMEFLDRLPGETVVVENDFSRFDRTLGVELLNIEMDAYKWFFRLPAKTLRYLQQQFKTSGRTKKGKIKYKCEGTRKSGDQNTSVGNTIINGVVNLYLVCQALDISDPTLVPMRGVFLGDDGYMLMKRHDADRVMQIAQDYYCSLGLKAKCRRVLLHEAEFCSSIFVPTQDGYILTPKPGRLMAKLFYSQKRLKPTKQAAWARGNVLGLINDVAHVPWLNVVFRHVLECTADVNALYDRQKLHQHRFYAERQHRPCGSSFEYYANRYGVERWLIEDFCSWYGDRKPVWQCFLSHPLLRIVHEVDV